MSRLTWAVTLLIVVLLPASQSLAQDTRAWQRPGSRVGEEITGPDGGKLVWAPAGEFLMGVQDKAADEKPAHRVRLSKGFWLGKCEVSTAQWRRYCREAQLPLPQDIIVPDNHPMGGVSWFDVQRYCRFYGLSLPTEAQWEWAARGPDGRCYPWGNQWDASRCSCQDNPGPDGFTFPVGSFPAGASWCGALDMAGNLAEWCADWYRPDYYAQSPVLDPGGPETGTKRVQRGGYCWASPDWCRAAKRFSDDPTNDGGSGCLRVCYTP